MRRKHPKLIRFANGKPATYSKTDDNPDECKKAFDCPTCGKRMIRGDRLIIASFVSDNNDFHIRHKRYCSEECSPIEIKSK